MRILLHAIFVLQKFFLGFHYHHHFLGFQGTDEDYEPWMAHSQHRAGEGDKVKGCLLGKREKFLRLKKDAW